LVRNQTVYPGGQTGWKKSKSINGFLSRLHRPPLSMFHIVRHNELCLYVVNRALVSKHTSYPGMVKTVS
jgi:hypothetical protein